MICEMIRDAKTNMHYLVVRDEETGFLIVDGPRRKTPEGARDAAVEALKLIYRRWASLC